LFVSANHLNDQFPVKELKGFKKVHLKPGQATVVDFELEEKDLQHYIHGQYPNIPNVV
jgi:hypothetical protein